eukprot:3191062-Pleurochrysis_carterae.AAC.3
MLHPATLRMAPTAVPAFAECKTPFTVWRKPVAGGSSGPCVFTLTNDVGGTQQRLIIGCYVDDLFVLFSHDGSDSLYAQCTSALISRWNVENEGPVSDLLNVDIHMETGCVKLSQEKYIDSLLRTYLPNGVPTSFHATHAPAADTLPSLVESALASKPSRTVDAALHREHMSLVGALLYCSTQTRPDIAYAVGMLCRTMSCPTDELVSAARRVLMYLSHHIRVGLSYVTIDNDELRGYSDSDWAHGTQHPATVSWSSKKQATVALSSCEAEIVAASEATKEAVYLRALFNELGLPAEGPTPLAMDNMSTIDLAYNPEHHART